MARNPKTLSESEKMCRSKVSQYDDAYMYYAMPWQHLKLNS